VAYANVLDVESILPEDDEEGVPDDARHRLETNLEEATDLVIGYLKREFSDDDEDEDGVPDDVPPAVRRVVARVALRGFLDQPDNPGAESEVNLMGPFSHTINWSKEAQARDFYLTDAERMRLDRFRQSTASSVGHVPMYGCRDYQ
jgi:hypothetical protein